VRARRESEATDAEPTQEYYAALTTFAQLAVLRGMSQLELGPRSGIGQGDLSRLEQGKQRVHWERIALLASVLQITPEELVRSSAPGGEKARQ
jgi:transcriptional regulator with XRE-family HTH domain